MKVMGEALGVRESQHSGWHLKPIPTEGGARKKEARPEKKAQSVPKESDTHF